MLKISDITNFTLQDYPENTACIIWFSGCNLLCKYCHNSEFLEQNSNFLSEENIFNFLNKRVGLFDGVVLSGGECTMAGNEFIDFCIKIKSLGFKIKIDTNGLNFNTIKNLIDDNVIDFIALDFKAPKEKFELITQINNNLYNSFEKTLYLLLKSSIDYEIRTTVHTELLQENDINNIIDILDNLNYKKNYYIQNFRNDNKKTLFNMKEQGYLLDKNKIKIPKNFKLFYRNFF